MPRARAFCLSSLLLLAAASVAAGQVLAAAEVACPRAAFPPTLDGQLEDWPRLPQAVIAGSEAWQPAAAPFAEYGGPQDISADVRVAWDNQALYLAVETRDDDLVRVRSAVEIDRGDSLVVAIAGEDPPEVNRFVVALLRGASLVWRAEPAAGAGNAKSITRAIWARPEEGGGTRVTYELAFPWAELPRIRPIPDTRLTLVVSVCDDDGGGMEGCVEGVLSIVLAGVGAAGPPVGPPTPSALPPVFPAPEVARFDRKCFTFQNRDAIIFAGCLDYARLPREAWADRLSLLQGAGFNTVALHVPWMHHQPAPGEADLADLKQVLSLCKEVGAWVQLHLGPYSGEDWPAGGVCGWLLSPAASHPPAQAVSQWYQAVLPIVAEHQLTAGGPVASVVLGPLPDAAGDVRGEDLESLLALVQLAGVHLPVLAANAPAARDNTGRALANVLDTLSFYEPPDPAALGAALQALSDEENGPAVVSWLPGDYGTARAARSSLDRVRVALGRGATSITLADAAPGLDPSQPRRPGDHTGGGIIGPAGGRTPGWGEARLLAGFLQRFGQRLARATPTEGLVQADDPHVRAAVRLTTQEGFLFVWDEKAAGPHQVRLTYLEPGSETMTSIPQAGAIHLPPGGAKILPLDVPLGRGVLRYATSEVAAIHPLGERILVVLYGDPDTPGEIALQWPGPPLVHGEVVRQSWDPETKTVVLDYYHGSDDRYLLVDELQIAVLSRERACLAATVAGADGAITLSGGAHVAESTLDAEGLRAVLECPEGAARVTAALPRAPAAVTLDGEPVPYTFTPPARVLTLDVTTEPFSRQHRAASVWDQLGRAILGGPPKLQAEFDRGWWMPDAEAPEGPWEPIGSLQEGQAGRAPEDFGVRPGDFVRLRARFDARDSSRIAFSGSTDPALVFVNGAFVPGLSGSAESREADVRGLLHPGGNEILVILHILPRAGGLAGLHGVPKRLPQVSLLGDGWSLVLDGWELAPGLAGEAAGWQRGRGDPRRWHLLRFGPWRAQGMEPAGVSGVAWYRVPFGVPRADGWTIPYQLRLRVSGAAQLYLNGARLISCRGDGEHVLSLPAPPLVADSENLLALAVYGLAPETGLHALEVYADEGRMTQRRKLEIRF